MNDLKITTNKSDLQIEAVHKMLSHSYWAQNISISVLTKAIENSLCFGVYIGQQQVGFARVITDKATFAWICDVIIDEKFRGQGLSKKLMKCILEHESLKNLRRVCLATKDAHQLYEQFGFKVTETPKNWMEIKDNDIYLKRLD